jgi:probable dihydroxyacetone kinase regulator
MAIRTKQLFADAVTELLREKPLEAITVKNLCEATGASRQTFYNHFLDKYDLIVWICRRQCRELWTSFQERRLSFRECMLEVYSLLDRNQAFYRVIMDMKGQGSFRDFLFSFTENYYQDVVRSRGIPLDSRLNYAISFTTVGTIEMAAKWIRDGYQMRPEEMIEYQLMCCPEILRPFLEPEEKA